MRSLSNIKEYSLSMVLPTVSIVKVRIYPIPATVLSARAGNFNSIILGSLASCVPRTLRRCGHTSMSFSYVCSKFLTSDSRISRYLRFFGTCPGTLGIISPIVNSGNGECGACASSLYHHVDRLISTTSVVAPGLARTTVLLNRPCPASPLAMCRVGDVLTGLSTGKPGAIMVADTVVTSNGVYGINCSSRGGTC